MTKPSRRSNLILFYAAHVHDIQWRRSINFSKRSKPTPSSDADLEKLKERRARARSLLISRPKPSKQKFVANLWTEFAAHRSDALARNGKEL